MQRWLAAAREAKHLPERLLHPWRRTRARRLLRTRPRSVLFVCLGNICRSPFAAEAFRKLCPGLAASISSGGLIGPGRPPTPLALAAARERGIPLDSHRSRLVTGEDVAGSELVVVMDPRQAEAIRRLGGRSGQVLVLGDLDPEPGGRRVIRDPYDQDAGVYAASYDRIDRCVRELARLLGCG